MKYFLLLIFLTSLLFSKVEIKLSNTNIKNGTTFAVIVLSDKKLVQAPNVTFLDKTYQMFTIDGNTEKYEVFLPVGYYTSLKKYKVEITYLENNKLQKVFKTIDVIDGDYKKNEIIKVPKGKVTLSKKNKKRAQKEYDIVYTNVYSKIDPYDLTHDSFFTNPMKSNITSAFGNARVYNGKARSYHTGTDFKASIGNDIHASNNGKVVLVMDRFYLGKVVYIDHGRGAYSYYAHMSKADVHVGEIVKKGQVIGQSGRSGRVTGPHLHYAMRLYNTTVDPLQYQRLYNIILKKYH